MPRRSAPPLPDDVNLRVAAALADLAVLQASREKNRAYAQAAAAIRDLDTALDVLVERGGTLPKIPRIGPSSLRVIAEVMHTGESATVEQAIEASGRRSEIETVRAMRGHFLSRAACRQVLATHGVYTDYRADFQMHSTWSDGSQTLDDIVTACLARGYTHTAVTDHSGGLPIANGLSNERFAQQFAAIDAVNARSGDTFRLLKGVEANIGRDGAPDVPLEERRAFEVVLVAPHSGLRAAGDQTARLVAAIASPWVHILAHPRGRKYGARPGLTADWPLVCHAAATFNVAIELDGDPSRQDLDWVVAREALTSGCVFALDSDAHATDELAYVDTAMAHARLAGIPADRIVNCWPLDRFLEWTRSRPS